MHDIDISHLQTLEEPIIKLRKSYLKKYSLEELSKKNNLKQDERNVVSYYNKKSIGHIMEERVKEAIIGERNVEIALKDILIEADGYDPSTKTLTEVKSSYTSKTLALRKGMLAALEIFSLVDLQELHDIEIIRLISVDTRKTNSTTTDYTVLDYTYEEFKNRKKTITPELTLTELDFKYAHRCAQSLIDKMIAINNK